MRQHHIQNDQIVRLGHGLVVAVQATAGQVHHKARLAQALAKIVTDFDLVFDDKNFHEVLFRTSLVVVTLYVNGGTLPPS